MASIINLMSVYLAVLATISRSTSAGTMLATTTFVSAGKNVAIGVVGNDVVLPCHNITRNKDAVQKNTTKIWKCFNRTDGGWFVVAGIKPDGTSEVLAPAFKERVQVLSGCGLKISNLTLRDSAEFMFVQMQKKTGIQPQRIHHRLIVMQCPCRHGNAETEEPPSKAGDEAGLHTPTIRLPQNRTNDEERKQANNGKEVQASSAGLTFVAATISTLVVIKRL